MGQSGLGRRMSMEHRGTQPTAPSKQVHWYLQLLWNVSPLLYTIPPNTQVAPSRAVGETTRGKVTIRSVHQGRLSFTYVKSRKSPNSQSLTCAHSYASVDGGSEVTVETFVWVTQVFLGAKLPHLFGTYPAAAAAIQHQAHSWGALRGGGGARTLAAALLTRSLSTRHTQTTCLVEHSVV